MELYLIRHGQSANNLRKQALAEQPNTSPAAAVPRMADPPLTDLGELQARLAGESLRDEGITTLYCGPMLRTLQTAQIIGTLLDLSPACVRGTSRVGWRVGTARRRQQRAAPRTDPKRNERDVSRLRAARRRHRQRLVVPRLGGRPGDAGPRPSQRAVVRRPPGDTPRRHGATGRGDTAWWVRFKPGECAVRNPSPMPSGSAVSTWKRPRSTHVSPMQTPG